MIIASKTSGRVREFNKKRSALSLKKACVLIENSMLEPFVERLILYGSTARGEQTYNSDIDLLLVLTKTKELQNYKKYIYMLKSELTSMDQNLPDVDLNIVIGNDWEKNEDLYYQDIRKDGIDIWKKEIPI